MKARDKRKFNRGLILGAFNPFHEGHEQLLHEAQKYCNLVDVYVGDRNVKHRLPRYVRAKTVENFINNKEWSHNFNIISYGKRTNLNNDLYSVFVAGSDILNLIYNRASTTHYVFSFLNTLCIHRKNFPLTNTAKSELSKHTNLMYVNGLSDISGSEIRKDYRGGIDIDKLVSSDTLKIIKPYIQLFAD